MDPRERLSDPEEAFRTAVEGLLANLWTALPCVVVSFDPAAMTVVLQPTILCEQRQTDGTTKTIKIPVLPDVPVVFPGGGGFTATFPIKAGDEALAIFSSRCHDGWWQSSGIQPQPEFRMHDLSDGFCIVGPRSKPRALSAISTNSAQLRTDDGAVYVEITSDNVNVVATSDVNVTAGGNITLNAGSHVTITAPDGCTVDTPTLTVTGVIDVQNINGEGTGGAINGNLTIMSGDVICEDTGVTLQTHEHTGVQSGGSKTGGPVSP